MSTNAVTTVLTILTIISLAQCGFLFGNSPSQIRQPFGPPPPPPPSWFQQMSPPNHSINPPPPPPLDVRSILSHVPIVSNLFRGVQRGKMDPEPQLVNNPNRYDVKPPNELFEQSSPQTKYIEGKNEVTEYDLSDNSSINDVTNNNILDEEITSTTEDYETTTDFDLLGRMGPPPAVVASLLGK